MRRFLVILLLIFLLIIPLPVSAQTPEPYTDPCNELPLRDWPNSRNIQIQNGFCAFQNGSLGPENPLEDFVLRFKVTMDPNAHLVFSYGTSMNDQYEFSITPTGVSLVNYIRFGNASNTVREKLLAKAPMQISPGQWAQVEFGMQANRQWLVTDGKTVIDRETARFYGVGISGSDGVYLDDIQLVQHDVSITGQQLPSFPEDLAQTWIVYLNSQYELAIIHPDGTGMQVLAIPLARNFPVQAIFSPDGKTLLINRGDGEKTILNFYSTETLQFIGTEISLPRAPKIDLIPDGQHLIVLRDDKASDLIFEKISIQTGQVVAAFPIPAIIDEQAIDIRSITTLDCSPTAESISIEVYADASGENIQRAILFDLASQQAHFLPGARMSWWSPDGQALFSQAGGLINPKSLVFTELPGDVVRRITNYRNYAWSPNGQFIHIGTENAGNEAYAVYIADLETPKLITLPLIGFGSFAPDSLRFIFSDQGRLIIRSLFDETELQIAEGSAPIWQPVPGMLPAEPTRPAQPAATAQVTLITPVRDTPSPASATAFPSTGNVVERPPLDGELSSAPSRPAWAVALLSLSLAGLVAAGSFAYLRYLRRCPSCHKPDWGLDPFCIHCGARFAQHKRTGTTLVLLGILLVAGGLAAAGIAGLLSQPKQNLTAAVVQFTSSPQPNRPTETLPVPTQDEPLTLSDDPCDIQNLARSNLVDVLQKANTTCYIPFISFSPDQRYIVLSGANYAKGISWTVLYDRETYLPLWVQQFLIEPLPFNDLQWSPTGDAFAVSESKLDSDGVISIYEVATGSLISQISPSTRTETFCSFTDLVGSPFRWLPDGKRLVRKIANAVQVVDSASGVALSETAFDDKVMGSPYSRDDTRCFYKYAWASDGSRFASVGASLENSDHPSYNGIKIWDAFTGELITENRSGWANTRRFAFSPDGAVLLVTGAYPALIDTSSGQPLPELNTCPVCESPEDILWTIDSQRVLVREDKNIGLYDRSTQTWKTYTLSTSLGNARAWLDDRGYVLMMGSGLPTVINVISGEEISLLEYIKSYP